MKPLVLARDLVLAVLAVAVVSPLFVLPWGAAAALGRLYGRVAGLFWGKARRAGMINLRRAYGESMTKDRARRETFAVFAGLGESIADGLQFSRRFPEGRRGWEALYAAEDPALEERLLADPRPKVFVTGHLGSWEVAAMLAKKRNPKGAVVARRVDNPFLDALVKRLRVSAPEEWIEKKGAAPEALARLERGQSVVMLLDENGGPRGPFVPFFGRPASTRKTAALLSLRTGAPIVVGAAVRRGTARYLSRLALLEPGARRANDADAIVELTRAITETWERWVREDPLQWRWIHWRWKSRPDGTEETYRRRDLAEAFS
jgi:KDO2-lipid IV(A) lauroyltransferase